MDTARLREAALLSMARAGTHPDTSWFEGHLGAAALAATFFAEEHVDALAPATRASIHAMAEGFLARSPHVALDAEAARASGRAAVDPILALLHAHARTLRRSGHGVIFGALGLRVLRDRPELCTHAVVGGFCALLARLLDDNPRRYFGTADYRGLRADEVSGAPEIASLDVAIARAFEELDGAVFDDQRLDGDLYFFGAEHLHVITHVHALAVLSDLGHGALAHAALGSVRLQIALSRHRPPRGAPHPLRPEDRGLPMRSDYWARPDTDGHLIKLAWSAQDLVRRLPATARERAELSLTQIWRYAMSRLDD